MCGDIFDRGPDAVKVYKYIRSIPKKRRILIRGNHEYLLIDLCNKSFPDSYDFSNGTVSTLLQFINARYDNCLLDASIEGIYSHFDFITNLFKKENIVEWIESKEWVNYFELNKYIFVHSFIPLANPSKTPTIFNNFEYTNYLHYFKDWRDNVDKQLSIDSTWGCPILQFNEGLFDEEIKKDKILVCGHWRVDEFYIQKRPPLIKEEKRKNKLDFKTFYSDHIIGLDACTALSGFCNVLVIDNDKEIDK